MNYKFFTLALIGLSIMESSGNSIYSTQASQNSKFAAILNQRIGEENINGNTILSPVSIQTCLGMALLGADGATAKEIIMGLQQTTSTKEEVIDNFEKIINSARSTPMVQIAYKLFVNKGYTVQQQFNAIAMNKFKSEVNTIDFSKSVESVKFINNWVESNTNNKIQNLLSDDSVDSETSMILVNAIYFKGEWEKPFSLHTTFKSDFWLNNNEKVRTDMMMMTDDFNYIEFDDLDAKAIQMRYKNSDLSMVILLPNQRDGLKSLHSKIANINFLDIPMQMKVHDVDVIIPKFKVEFSINLVEILKSMGMTSMFSDNADFKHLFTNNIPVKVSQVVHKAFIDVNEAGSEAAAATYMKIVPMSLNLNQKRIYADHPFIYMIMDKTSVYFVGQVTKF